MNPVLSVELNLPITIFKEDDGFVSYCPALDVSSQGNTQEEAKENLAEAVTGFMISCYEMGTLSNVLRQCGFVPVSQGEMDFAEPDSDFIHIPLPFMLPEGKKGSGSNRLILSSLSGFCLFFGIFFSIIMSILSDFFRPDVSSDQPI